ncbi:MAG: hypothetical protein WD851_11370 [Pirellulales bacterium]
MKRLLFGIGIVLVTGSSAAHAAPAVNGTLVGDEAFYGDAKSIQNTDTGFGNATQGDSLIAFGSEIDQVFATVFGDRLYVLVTGNLESNFNKLEIFVDSVTGGHNTLVGANLPKGVDPFSNGGFQNIPAGNNPNNNGALQAMNGLTFDAGFNADYYLTFTHGTEDALVPNDPATTEVNESTRFYAMSAHYADLTQGASGATAFAGVTFAPDGLPNVLRASGEGLSDFPFVPNPPAFPTSSAIGPALPGLDPAHPIDRTYATGADGDCESPTGVGCVARELEFVLPVDPNDNLFGGENERDHRNALNTIELRMAVNNSNTVGVDGLVGGFPDTLGNPQDVVTGVEFSIPLSQIGNPTGDIRITAFVNNGGHDYASNQFAGDGILGGNPGSNGTGGFTDGQLAFSLASIAGNQFVTVANTFVPASADYNGNGVVDAADYTVWRDTLGSTTNLDADGNGNNVIDAGDYDEWRQAFGEGAGSGASDVAVPEPGSLLLVLLSFSLLIAFRTVKARG